MSSLSCAPSAAPLTRPQARVALLEGEHRAADTVKTLLLRRIKMLEFQLRRERYVSLPHPRMPGSALQSH